MLFAGVGMMRVLFLLADEVNVATVAPHFRSRGFLRGFLLKSVQRACAAVNVFCYHEEGRGGVSHRLLYFMFRETPNQAQDTVVLQ